MCRPQHPIVQLAADGANVGISSDDPTCFDAYVNDEVRIAHEKIGLSVKQLAQCVRFTMHLLLSS